MRGILYQLKCVGKDKFCIMSFLLPIVFAMVLNMAGSINLSSLGEFHFGVTPQHTSAVTVDWLAQYGSVTVYSSQEALTSAINDPSTNLIGVAQDGEGIRTMVAGDEMEIFRQTADNLPTLYAERGQAAKAGVQVLPQPDMMAGYENLFIAITLIVAMFMDCTFNSMNIISEKEEGVAIVNDILPMTRIQYVGQKIIVGFVFGAFSAMITAALCFHLAVADALVVLVLVALSAFVSSLIGLFVGRVAENIMVGVAYIKIVMIIFIAVPLLYYLLGAENDALRALCYLVPSSATFEGIMALANGSAMNIGKDIAILMFHCVGWLVLALPVFRKKKHPYL